MPKGIFSCEINYDTHIEAGPEYHLALECGDKPFDFTMNSQLLELVVPRTAEPNSCELMPDHLMVRTKFPVWVTDAKKLHDTLIKWKVSFRGWYQILTYVNAQTLIIIPDNSLFMQTRLPNNSFFRSKGPATRLIPKPYTPKQWHIWPKEPVSRDKMEKIIERSSNFKNIPVHYELLVNAIVSFNDEYFDLAVTYSAMALERAMYDLATAVPRSKADFGGGLDCLIEQGLVRQSDRQKYIAKFTNLLNDKLTLGELLRLLPVLPFNKSVKEMRNRAAELLVKVNNPRIGVLHHGKHANRDAAHESVTTTMNLIYGSLAP